MPESDPSSVVHLIPAWWMDDQRNEIGDVIGERHRHRTRQREGFDPTLLSGSEIGTLKFCHQVGLLLV